MDSTTARVSPYPGLRPYGADEADVFFGREQQTDELLTKLQSHRFIAVTGPSGCGKSSLIKAGLIPALRAGFMLAAGSRWRFCEIRPGQHPILSLATALASPEVLGEGHEQQPFIDAALRFGPLGLTQVVRESELFRDASLLVLVDQFEEIFRFRERINPDEADAFVRLLLTSAGAVDVPIYVVMTMRSDYLGDCALFHGLPEAINAGQYLTPRLTREQCAAAIVGPARVGGGDVDAALVNRLLNDFGPDPDQLPLLQHALMRMWMRKEQLKSTATVASLSLTMDDYEAVGGLAHALARHADEALGELDDSHKYLAEILFRRLTERGTGRRDTRAPARVGEVAAIAAAQVADIAQVVKVFRGEGRHFVTAADDPVTDGTLLDIGHESLIRQWGTLTAWVDAEAESATTYRRLVDFARLWKKNAAGLWRPPELELARAWRDAQLPNAAWAERYSSRADFDLAMEFLGASQREWEAEQARMAAREEEERRRERERIEQEAQRGRLEALAKAAQAEAELERTKVIAERQARRNRVLRAATVLLSASVVALLAAIVGYRYLWVWEHVDFYNAVVKKRGVPSGVGSPLTASQVQHRESSYKLIRRGTRGPVMRAESVDAEGHFAGRESGASAYMGDSGNSDNEGRTVQWEYVYDNKGEIAYEVQLDARGRQLSSMVYMPEGADRKQRTAHFFGPDGAPAAPSESCAEYVQVQFSDEGYESHLRYMDRRGRTAPGRDHARQLEQHFDRNGNTIEQISLDEDGRRMIDLYGNSAVKVRYDALGNEVEQILYDERDAPTAGADGWVIERFKYDVNGNLLETTVFDDAGRPVLHRNGWHRYTRILDANGRSVREQNWGINGEPVAQNGCHEYRLERDARGRVLSTHCVDANGQLHAETSIGVPTWRRTYDDEDNVIEWSYFDDQGRPVNNSLGFHRDSVKFDDRGQVVEVSHLGPDGKRVNRREGYAQAKITFDGDKEIRRVYLDADGKPPADLSYAERRREYDRSGNLERETFYDGAGKPKEQADGYVGIQNIYDGCGQVAETRYLGPDGLPQQTKSRDYAAIRYGRDRLGRVVRQTYLSERLMPTMVAGGFAAYEDDLDARGNLIERRYLGKDGRLTVASSVSYAILHLTLNRQGQKTSEEYLGVDRKPARLEVVRITHAYDGKNQLAESRHFGSDPNRPIGIERFTYNDLGQKVEEAYFSADDQPFLRGTGYGDCFRLRFTYDEAGEVTERTCFDRSGKWSRAKPQRP